MIDLNRKYFPLTLALLLTVHFGVKCVYTKKLFLCQVHTSMSKCTMAGSPSSVSMDHTDVIGVDDITGFSSTACKSWSASQVVTLNPLACVKVELQNDKYLVSEGSKFDAWCSTPPTDQCEHQNPITKYSQEFDIKKLLIRTFEFQCKVKNDNPAVGYLSVWKCQDSYIFQLSEEYVRVGQTTYTIMVYLTISASIFLILILACAVYAFMNPRMQHRR